MTRSAKFLVPILVTLVVMLGAGLFAAPAHAHGQGAHATQPATSSPAQHAQAPTEQTMPHCHIGAICAPVIETQGAAALSGPDPHTTLLRGDHGAFLPRSRSPGAEPPPPRG